MGATSSLAQSAEADLPTPPLALSLAHVRACTGLQVSRMRVMNRAWAGVAAAAPGGDIGAALAADAVLRNATRFALKNGEHTWGRDVKSNLVGAFACACGDIDLLGDGEAF